MLGDGCDTDQQALKTLEDVKQRFLPLDDDHRLGPSSTVASDRIGVKRKLEVRSSFCSPRKTAFQCV
jgi:hypothetical protein